MNQVAKTEEHDVPTIPAAITPTDMLRIAVEQNADLDKIEKLMGLQERWEATEAKKAFISAMSRFREKCPTIDKTRTAHNSKYAGLAETLEQIHSLLSENGLSHSWKTDQNEAAISVTCCVTHTAGHQECTTMTAGADTSGSKNSIQALGSTVTYLQRYTLFAILGLASKEQDNDANLTADTVTRAEAAHLEKLADEVGANKRAALGYLKVSSFEEIPANKYDSVVASLEKKRNV